MNNLQTQEHLTTGTAQRQNGQTHAWPPPIDIHETKDAYFIRAEMPGVRKEGLEITAEGPTLTLTGRRADPPFAGTALHRESRAADFRRVFELDPTIDTAKIRARIDQGLVTIELPKAERVKPRKIKIAD